MIPHFISAKVAPTLVAAGLTLALSTALVAAAGPGSHPNENADNSHVVAAQTTDHSVGGNSDTAGKPADPGAQGQAQHANNGQGSGTNVDSSSGSDNDSSNGRGPNSHANSQASSDQRGQGVAVAGVQSQGQGQGQGQGQDQGRNDNAGNGSNGVSTQNQETELEGERDCQAPFENHGAYVSCVARGEAQVQGLNVQGLSHGEIVREAAHSDTGKSAATANQQSGSNQGQNQSQNRGQGKVHGQGHGLDK